MSTEWLPSAILRVASLLAPGDERAEWLTGWQSELWYIPRRQAIRFSLGAFQDALWLRRNHLSPEKPGGMHLESPLLCLAVLAAIAAGCCLIALYLPAPKTMTQAHHLKARELPEACIAMLLLFCGFFPAVRLAMGSSAARSHPVPWTGRLRLGVFLTLKIALVQPILLCGFLAAGVTPMGAFGLWAFWAIPCRWVLVDQRRRCPACLRLLTNPVRIGTPSETFLEWYGAESICARGHGLLHTTEISSSYSAKPEWLRLGDSWTGLFSEAAGMRQR